MSVEKLLLQYRKNVLYKNDPTNWIGPEDGSAEVAAIRTGSVEAYNVLTHKCVRKFGIGYGITDITNAVINTPRGAVNSRWRYEFYDIDTDTLLGSVLDVGASVFTDGAVLGSISTGIYVKTVWEQGAGPDGPTNGDTITLTTDTDPGGLVLYLSGENLQSAAFTWALSATGSTYYAATDHDQTMKYGGYRHSQTGTDKLPYFKIALAVTNLGAAFLYAHILDSETYDEREILVNGADYVIQAASGQYPRLTCGIGQRITRGTSVEFNNSTTLYFNENGVDGNDGTWQSPMETPQFAVARLAGVVVNAVYGGIGATESGGVYYASNITLAALANSNIEADHGYMPRIVSSTPAATAILYTAATQRVRGFYIQTIPTNSHGIDFNGFAGTAIDNTITGGFFGVDAPGAFVHIIQDNIVRDTFSDGINVEGATNTRVERNITHGCGARGIDVTWGTQTLYINDNICYDNVVAGIHILAVNGDTQAGELKHNLCYGNTGDGFYFLTTGATLSWAVTDNISAQNGDVGYEAISGGTNVGLARCNAYGNTTSATAGPVTHAAFNGNDGADAKAVDPKFMDEANNNFALRRESTITKVATTLIDLGPRLRLIKVDEDDIIINGLYLDGQDQYFLGVFKEDTDDWEGMNLKYCELYGLQGIAIDDYCDGSSNPSETIILGVSVHDCGGGIKHWAGENTIDDFLSYGNIEDDIGTLYDTVIDHAAMHGGENGLWAGAIGFGTRIINSISDGHSSYGIDSAVEITPTYCCIADAITDTVDMSAASNFTSNPLFISGTIGSEDLHIKTVEGGYTIDSDCKDAASDGGDIGAWAIDRNVDTWSMRRYEFEFNPNVVREGILEKGLVRWTNGLGALDLYAAGFKRIFELRWQAPQVSSAELRRKIKFFSQQIKNRLFATPDDYRVFRFHTEKDDYLDSGSTGVVDATAKTLTDAAKSFVEYQFQGYHVGIKLETGSGTGTISAAGKTLTVAPSPVWTTDEHEGRFIYRGYYYYYIKSNTGDVLTLSDPEGTLSDASNIDWAIEQYLKILYTDLAGIMHLEDSDGILVDGTYEWYIDFIEVVLQRPGAEWTQPRFDPDREHSKVGFRLRLEER